MRTDRVFQITLLVSVLVHGVILLQNPDFYHPFRKESKPPERKEENIEVSYLKPVRKIKVPAPEKAPRLEPLRKLPDKITVKETALPPINREEIFKEAKEAAAQKNLYAKPAFMKPEMIAVKTKITLSSSEADNNKSPTYVAHSQLVRERIKQALYHNYGRMEVGQVYLSFVLSRNGQLKEYHLVDDKSTAAPYLKEIALESVKDAVPFPAFPKELDYDELSFNVVISFEVE